MKPLSPETLIQNRYKIVHLIGKGGMGEVYLAVDQRLGSAVALKRTFFSDDELLANAFEREARILANVRHPILPKVSDHFIEGDNQYLVMEHIAGDDLSKRLEKTQQSFPLSWVLFWADQLLDSLNYLHTHQPPIIHRDIKPQNLKLTDDNQIVLLDFGLSKNSVGEDSFYKWRKHRKCGWLHTALRANGANSRHRNKRKKRSLFAFSNSLPTFDKCRSARCFNSCR